MPKAKKNSVVRPIRVRKPNENVVVRLEELLEEARAGETIGIAYVALNRESFATTGFVGVHHWQLGVLGGVALLQDRILKALQDD